MPSISGVLETGLYVDDMERAVRFYDRIFGFEKMVCDDRFCAYSVAGRQVLLFFKRGGTLKPLTIPGGVIPPHDGSGQLHMAFSIPKEDLEGWEKRLTENGVPIESKVTWELGGQSLYFRDPDDHLIELATPGIWPIF